MTIQQKKAIDYIPLAILIVFQIVLLWQTTVLNIGLDPRHILGIIFIGITTLLFYAKHNSGVLALGVTLVLGLIGAYSFDPNLKTIMHMVGESGQGHKIAFFILNPLFFLLIALHVILSWNYYVRIFSNSLLT
jgi:hypothetical protein